MGGHPGFTSGRLSAANPSGDLDLLARRLYETFARWRRFSEGLAMPEWEHLDRLLKDHFRRVARELTGVVE